MVAIPFLCYFVLDNIIFKNLKNKHKKYYFFNIFKIQMIKRLFFQSYYPALFQTRFNDAVHRLVIMHQFDPKNLANKINNNYN